MGPRDMQVCAVPRIPMIRAGDDLASIIGEALAADGRVLRPDDVLVVAQKIVSKAEDRVVALDSVLPGPEARDLARRTGQDPRVCQLVVDESARILTTLAHHIITVDNRGLVDTSAGVDSGNAGVSEDWACLLPEDPDLSARRIRDGIRNLSGVAPGVIVSDSMGSPWREGSCGAAIGLAGIAAIERLEGDRDLYGNAMRGCINRVDELAAAASVLMGQGAAACPVVLIRGAAWTADEDASIRGLLVPDPANSFPLVRVWHSA